MGRGTPRAQIHRAYIKKIAPATLSMLGQIERKVLFIGLDIMEIKFQINRARAVVHIGEGDFATGSQELKVLVRLHVVLLEHRSHGLVLSLSACWRAALNSCFLALSQPG